MSLDFLALGDIWAAVLGSMLSCLCVREGVAASGGGGWWWLKVWRTLSLIAQLPISAQMMENPRKRKHSSEDSSQVRTGKCLCPQGSAPSALGQAQAGRWLCASEHWMEAWS